MDDKYTATVLEWDGDEGLAEDLYGNVFRFYEEEVYPADRGILEEGDDILVPDEGFIEMVSQVIKREEESEFEDEQD